MATFPDVFRPCGSINMVESFHILKPISEENLQLPKFDKILRIASTSEIKRTLYGFGFDKLNRLFKLVVFVFHGVYNVNVKMLVFDLEGVTSRWKRILGDVPCMMRFAFPDYSNAYADGCLHWITGSTMPNSTDYSLVITSFSLSDAVFGVLQTPELIVVKQPFFLMQADFYTLAVLDDCLCWVDSNSEHHITIWIKKSVESWTKSFCLKTCLIAPCIFGSVTPIKFEKNGVLFLQYGYRIICYNVQDHTVGFFDVDEEPPQGMALGVGFPFVGSFIPVNSH